MRSALFVAVLAIAGCKGKPKHRPPPENLTQVDPNAKPSSTPSTAAPDIVLPHGDGSPPKKTTAPLTLDELIALQRRNYKGFQSQPHAISAERGSEIAYLTEDHPRIVTTITIAPCSDKAVLGGCVPINLGAWTARTGELKKMVPPDLRDLPDTKFEVGVVKFHATDLIYTFQVGQTSGVKTTGSAAGRTYIEYTYAYILYYNDGHNQIRVVAEVKDSANAGRTKMVTDTPPSDLANTAQAFFDATTQLW
ncbi:MAG: hypothetical protein ABI591_29250 [Kofleriaceae bacterium]